ncbi:MAG: hypothetical protein EGS78_08930 [Bacteroidales bacterium]|nr:hypothetical protein [Bacteroidales bacterium]
MTRSKLFLVTLLMSVSVLASAAVKIVPEPLEIKKLSEKIPLPSEITVSALENDNMVDTYIELSSGILKNNGITLKKGGRNSVVRLAVSDKINDRGAYMINVGKRHIDIMAHEPYGGFYTQDEIREVAWSVPESLSEYKDFLSRLTGAMIPLYTSAGWPFAKYYEEVLK